MGNMDIVRLSPTMASRKLQVLDFIRLYHGRHGVGPSLSEIAAAVGTNRARVQDAIRKLAREGLVHHEPGVPRGVKPIEAHEEALRVLLAIGWTVAPEGGRLIGPMAPAPPIGPLIDIDADGQMTVTNVTVTNAGLPETRARAYLDRQLGEKRHGGGDGNTG